MANAKAAAAAAALKQRQESGGAKSVGILDPMPDRPEPDADGADAPVPGDETQTPEPELPEIEEHDDREDDGDADDVDDVVVPAPTLITHPIIAPEQPPAPVIDRVGFAPVETADAPPALTYPEPPAAPTPDPAWDLSHDAILMEVDYDIPPEKDTVARPAVPPAPTPAPVELVDVDAQGVASGVGPLHKRVFGDVADEVVKAALRDGVQAIRQAVAVAQARGMMPRKTLSMVVVIDTDLNGNAQVFAGDMTIR